MLIQVIAVLAVGGSFLYSYLSLKSTLRGQCQAQNKRHDRTVAFLNGYVRHYEQTHKLSPIDKKAVAGQASANIALINDLQPHRNCGRIF